MKKMFLPVLFTILLFTCGCIQAPLQEQSAGQGNETQQKPVIDRDSYGLGIFLNESQQPIKKPIKEAFANLPMLPNDFWEKRNSFESGDFSIAKQLDENYYLQPEFLPEFKEIGLPYWKNPDLSRWGAYGFGVYPANQNYSIKKEEEITVFAFVHSAYYIQSFQGIKLVVVDTNTVQENFVVEIEPENILLGPTYPVIDKKWMHKVAIKIKAKEDTPARIYSIGFDAIAPDAEAESKWSETQSQKYFSGAGNISINRPRLNIFLKVE